MDSIVGVDNGVLTVSGKNEKGQLRLFTVELPQGFVSSCFCCCFYSVQVQLFFKKYFQKVAEDSTIAAFHCDCF